jgi:hypothetical protein
MDRQLDNKFTRTVKIKTNVRGLDVLTMVYAFAMTLGLTQVFTASQAFLTRVLSGTAPLSDEKTILVLLLFANIAFLGLRFFWVPRNLQSLVISAARVQAIDPKAARERGDLSNLSIAFHLVTIFLHGTLFYLICAEFEFITFAISSNLPLAAYVFVGYVIMHISLLLLNAAWIGLIRQQEIRLETRLLGDAAGERPSAGNVWWRNNLVASLCALAPYALSSTCKSAGSQCVRQFVDTNAELLTLFPTSPQVLATGFYKLTGALEWLGFASAHWPVYWVLMVLLINSLHDLLNAGRFYVFFEDVEWESTREGSRVAAPIEE